MDPGVIDRTCTPSVELLSVPNIENLLYISENPSVFTNSTT